jgi:7-cyano-7-deazaguanine synthase in queuosine biosynthesis
MTDETNVPADESTVTAVVEDAALVPAVMPAIDAPETAEAPVVAPIAPAVPIMRSVIGELRAAATSALTGRGAAITTAVSALETEAKKTLSDKFEAYRNAISATYGELMAKANEDGHIVVEDVHAAINKLGETLMADETEVIDALKSSIAAALAMDVGEAMHEAITKLENAW